MEWVRDLPYLRRSLPPGSRELLAVVVQFLVGVDRDLEAMKHHVGADIAIMRRTIEEHFSKIGDATRIYSTINSSPLADSVMDVVENLAGITGESPELGRRLLGSEIQSLTHLLKGFTEGRATYEGEDQDWILRLTRLSEVWFLHSLRTFQNKKATDTNLTYMRLSLSLDAPRKCVLSASRDA